MKINLNIVSPKKIMNILVMMIVLNCGAAQAQPQQGLMSRLIEIKYSTELYLTTQIKNETNPAKKDSALALYNTMRWKLDGFVYQISSALITQNSPKVFKQIDAWCYAQKEPILNVESNQNIAAHVASFAEIEYRAGPCWLLNRVVYILPCVGMGWRGKPCATINTTAAPFLAALFILPITPAGAMKPRALDL